LAILEANYDNQMLTDNPLYPPALKSRIRSDMGHLCNTDSGKFVAETLTPRNRKLFLAHLSRKNNTPDLARETVSRMSGIPRFKIDCLEYKGDTRTVKF
jgi:phosphoribosyl 1,2-cyclic phosphodiesterase